MRRFFSGFLVLVAILLVSGTASADRQPYSPGVDPGRGNEQSAPRSPVAGSGMVRLLKPQGDLQAAAGELALVSLSAEPSRDLATVTFTDLCIRNYRGTAANDVWVEGWVSSQIPQVGGDTTHFKTSQYAVGLVPAASTRCVTSGTVPMTPPAPGLYWTSVALYEGSGPNRVLQFIYTEPVKWDAGGPFSSSTLYMEKPLSYYITNGGNTASLQVGRVKNSGSQATRQLMLSLEASTTVPRYGSTINSLAIASKEYSPLNPGYSYTNLDTGALVASQPPAGTYWITAMLHQRGTDGVWYYTSIYTFPNQYTFTGTSPAPSAEFTFTPTTPLVGQSVSFTDTSTGNPASWSWSFGNGATSTARNPTYAYPAAGSYSVSLTATNAGGSSTRTKSITVLAPTPPVITYFGANPPSVVAGQQSILTWTSTGGTSASIDQGIGAVPTSGSIAVTPVLGVPYRLTVSGPGGSASATVTISAVPSTFAGTWLLPSSARAPGQNAFWTTDLVVMNPTAETASVNVKFLGHEGSGASGPERIYSIPPRSTRTWADVLGTMFGRETDWGPILVRSTASSLVVQGQTWTASPNGGSYGQSVAATSAAEAIGASPKAIAGVRQDSTFRTNLVLANMKETDATVAVTLLLPDGMTATQRTVPLPPLGFQQLNVASQLGVENVVGGSFLVSCSTPGCQVAAYASVIDASTADPRTLLAR